MSYPSSPQDGHLGFAQLTDLSGAHTSCQEKIIDYSRHADLGVGIIAYPIEAGGWTILALAAALSRWLDRRISRSSGLPIYLTAALTTGVLAITAKAAPIMFRVRGLGDDPTALRDAFDEFFTEQRNGSVTSPTGLQASPAVNRR